MTCEDGFKCIVGCWNWKGFTDKDGYGKIMIRQKTLRAHRVYYTVFKGQIPKGLVIDHLCRNTSCVNPEHLEAVTSRENTLRGESYCRNKTQCKHGHEFTPENTYIRRDKIGRQCKTCRDDYSKKWRKI